MPRVAISTSSQGIRHGHLLCRQHVSSASGACGMTILPSQNPHMHVERMKCERDMAVDGAIPTGQGPTSLLLSSQISDMRA